MKILITAFLLTATTFANTCQLNLAGRSIGDTYFYDEGEASFFTEIETGKISLAKEEFEANITFSDFDYANCHDALIYKVFVNPITSDIFRAVYTNEDFCDGGNSYGYITLNNDSKIIAIIQDSDFNCL